MNARRKTVIRSVSLLLALSFAGAAQAKELRFAIQVAQAGDARKYQGLLDYLGKRGVPARFVTAPDFRAAAKLFGSGDVDVMFGGSGVSGAMIIKEVAEPFVWSLPESGPRTYGAVILAPVGSPKFDGTVRYFEGKKVIFAALASAGEFYFHSLGPSKAASQLHAASHQAAIDALSRGKAEVAVVKDVIWEKEKARFPGIAKVGADDGVNPDGMLMISRKVGPEDRKQLASILLALEADGSPEAMAAKGALKIRGFGVATLADFAHTLVLLKRAGVTKAFDFTF